MDDNPTPRDDAVARTHHVTLALQAARGGDPAALNEAFQLVYEEVRRSRGPGSARFGVGSTLDTTAVVHEAYLKLARHGEMAWEDRQHFLAVASAAMRQVLLDHARRHLSLKRGGGAAHVPLTEADAAVDDQARDILALDAALTRLAGPRRAARARRRVALLRRPHGRGDGADAQGERRHRQARLATGARLPPPRTGRPDGR